MPPEPETDGGASAGERGARDEALPAQRDSADRGNATTAGRARPDHEQYEGYPGHVSLQTTMLQDLDGRTRLVANSVFRSVEDRDGMVQAGMEEGVQDGYDKLDEILGGLLG